MPFKRGVCGVIAALAIVSPCAGQLTNAGFESSGTSTEFDGWAQFGNVDTAFDLTSEGTRSAKLWGTFSSTWSLSAVYQDVPAAPGALLAASVYAGHPSTDPLVGAARAVLNVEWLDSGGGQISYESFDLVDASDTPDVMAQHTRVAGPAPAGTATARILLGFLQSPANEPGSVRFDLASVTDDPATVHEALQWVDFDDQVAQFAGYSWRGKEGSGLGPGPNTFSSGTDNAWVDAFGHLHLRVTFDGSDWVCPEIVLVDALGHGDYVFVTRGRVDEIDPNLVLGMFLWEYQASYDGSHLFNVANEFDIELSRWGNPSNPNNSQFVAQPWNTPGNLSGFNLALDGPGDLVTQAFLWRDGQVVCRAWRGDETEPTSETLVHQFNYTGPDVPRDEAPRIHLNFWLLFGDPPTDGQEAEVVIESFRFTPQPACVGDLDGDGDTDVFDFGGFTSSFGDPVPALTRGDLDGNGGVDVFDFGMFAASFGCDSSRRAPD